MTIAVSKECPTDALPHAPFMSLFVFRLQASKLSCYTFFVDHWMALSICEKWKFCTNWCPDMFLERSWIVRWRHALVHTPAQSENKNQSQSSTMRLQNWCKLCIWSSLSSNPLRDAWGFWSVNHREEPQLATPLKLRTPNCHRAQIRSWRMISGFDGAPAGANRASVISSRQ